MKLLAFALTLFALSQSSYGKDITVGEAFTVSVPDSAVEQPRSDHSYGVRDTILQKYKGDSFEILSKVVFLSFRGCNF